MNKLYLECTSGISGDMFVAAMLDLGANQEKLIQALNTIPVKGYEIQISRVKKSGLDACDFNVILDDRHENHDHDMDYLYGTPEHPHADDGHHHHEEDGHHYHDGDHHYEEDGHHHNGDHHHEEDGHHHHDGDHHHHEEDGHHHHDGDHHHGEDGHHHHDGDHHHEEDGHHHDHVHRGLREVMDIINQTQMTDGARSLATKIFRILGEAEAKAHGTTLEEVHFHEVGAVDSIIDILAAAICLDDLQITETIIPCLWEGRGTVRCQHGVLPVPVPAVVNVIQASGLPVHLADRNGELITPTGAAIAAAVCTAHQLPQRYRICRVGIGAGKRAYEIPSLLRAMLIEEAEQDSESREVHGTNTGNTSQDASSENLVCKLETNIDDCSGEILGHIMNRLFEAGARDVFYLPIYMKKNRPAYELSVICLPEDVPVIEEMIFSETTTIGIRKSMMERTVLPRECCRVETSLGEAEVKICTFGDKKRIYPEYSSAAELSIRNALPLKEVYEQIVRECSDRV